MRTVAIVAAVVLVHVVNLTSTSALAQTSATVSDESARARLARVEAALYEDASASQLWYFGWSGLYAATAGAQLTVALVATDPGLRADARVGTVKSGLGFIGTMALPPPAIFFSPCTASEKATPAALSACLARQEARLDDAAKAERFARSILPTIASVAVNVGAGLYLWLHDDRLASAIVSTVVGIAVSQLQIATRPTIARDFRIGFAPHPGGGVVVAAVTF